MKSMLKYIFSSALLAISILGNAQEKDTTAISYPERYGLRVGVDLHRLSKSFYEKEYKGLEIIGDYRLTQRFYLAGELGNEDKTVDDDRLNFTTNGTYFKAGFDFNSFEALLSQFKDFEHYTCAFYDTPTYQKQILCASSEDL